MPETDPEDLNSPSSARPVYVGVIGPGEATDAEIATAEEVGRLLAQRQVIMVCGGLGGVMNAAARGASQARGMVVGLLPGNDRREANAHIGIALPTGLGEMRNALIVRASDVLVAVGGAYGTLSEIALALRTDVPVVGLGTWELADVIDAPDPTAAVELALALAGSTAEHT